MTTVDNSLLAAWQQAQAQNIRPSDDSEPLQSGGGGGTYDGMEGRVAKLEDAMVEVKVNIATLAERISHLPSKGFVFAAMSGVGAAIVVALTILGQLGFLKP